MWKEAADVFLEEAGVNVLYHVNFIKAFLNDEGAVDYLLMKGTEGHFAIKPGYVVDASGDAEVVHSVSGETSFGANGVVQSPTMIFKLGGVDMKTFLQFEPPAIDGEIIAAVHNDSQSSKWPQCG